MVTLTSAFGQTRTLTYMFVCVCLCNFFFFFFPCCSLDALRLTDEHIKQSLVEKQQILAALYDTVMGQVTPHRGLLLRGDASDLQQGESLLMGAIYEGKC